MESKSAEDDIGFRKDSYVAVEAEDKQDCEMSPYCDTVVNQPEDDDHQSEVPIGASNMHIFAQIHQKGAYKKKAGETTIERMLKPTVRLDVTFSITSINNINHVAETFESKVRVFAFWKVDLHAIGMEKLAAKALASGHYCHMKRDEIEEFERLSPTPEFGAMNVVSMDSSELADIRVYGGRQGDTAVLWNKGFTMTCKSHFDFQSFPFDQQELVYEFRLNNLKQWEHFNLSVSNVQFHRQAMQHAEWVFNEPIVHRVVDIPTAATDIKIQIHRHPAYYLQNIVVLMTGLILLNLLVFALEIAEVGIRLLGVFTIILNSVAFKLFYSTLLPKVSYNTILDYFIFENFAILGLTALFCVIPSFYEHKDEEYSKRLNVAMVLLSLFLCVLSTLKLVRQAYVTRRKVGSRTKRIELIEGKSWYSFRYSKPHYLPEVATKAAVSE